MYHSVHNLSDCISINENWCNGYNIQHINESIKQSYSDTYNECCKWNTQSDNSVVQYMMRSNSGMDYTDYIQFILYTVDNEIQQYNTESEQIMLEYHTTSLRKLRFILHELSLKTFYTSDEINNIKHAFSRIGDVLDRDNTNQRYKQIYKSRQI